MSTRNRLESISPKDHEDHIAEKGLSSCGHSNLVHKFVPVPQAMKILDAKAAVGEAQKVAGVAIDQSKEQKKRLFLEAHKEQRTVHFATPMYIL